MARYLGDVADGRENNFTFVRLICASLVIYGHSYAVTKTGGGDLVAQLTGYAFAGGVAVDIFFLISGFLVTASLTKGGLLHYAVSRGLRIYPALFVNMVIAVFVLGAAATTLPILNYLRSNEVWAYFLGLSSTLHGAFFLPGVFADHKNTAVNGSIWSVLIEVRLYVILAVIYAFGLLKSPARFNALFFLMTMMFWMNPDWLPEFARGSTNSHVCFLFFVGVFLYINRFEVPISVYALLIALLLCGMTLGTPKFSFAYMLFLIAGFLSICFGNHFAWFDRFGDFSYGVYLYGWPVQQFVLLINPDVSALVNTFFSVLICLILGFLSWHLVESPFLRRKNSLVYSVKSACKSLQNKAGFRQSARRIPE